MKFPWDRHYFKISFYVIFTAIIIYILMRLMDAVFYTVSAPGSALKGLGSFIGSLFSLFSPLIFGFIIAYILDPLAGFYQRHWERIKPHGPEVFHKLRKRLKKKPGVDVENSFQKRTAGAFLSYATILAVIAGLVFFFIGKMEDTGDIAKNISNMVNNTIQDILIKISGWQLSDFLLDQLNHLINELNIWLSGLVNNIVEKASAAGLLIVNLVLSMVISFYMLQRKDRALYMVRDIFKTFTPYRWQKPVQNFMTDLHSVFSGYIRGQITDAVILAVLMSAGLMLAGVDFAVIIGVITGFGNLIPFVGAVVGFVLSVSVALLSGSWVKAVYAAAVVLLLQQVDGMILAPKIVGDRVKLSPPAVILALGLAGRLFGLVGMVFAVPVCAMIKILLTRFAVRYKMERKPE